MKKTRVIEPNRRLVVRSTPRVGGAAVVCVLEVETQDGPTAAEIEAHVKACLEGDGYLVTDVTVTRATGE